LVLNKPPSISELPEVETGHGYQKKILPKFATGFVGNLVSPSSINASGSDEDKPQIFSKNLADLIKDEEQSLNGNLSS
jgi:hypothetical protein